MKKEEIIKRLKNPYFWLGLGGAIFCAAGIDFNTLTSWDLLFKAMLGILKNPVAVVAVISTAIGVWVNPTTPGFKDDKETLNK